VLSIFGNAGSCIFGLPIIIVVLQVGLYVDASKRLELLRMFLVA
jgi:hypothetical protein